MAPWPGGGGTNYGVSASRELPINRGTRHELLPAPLRAHARDGRQLGDAWLVGDAARNSKAISAEDLVGTTSFADVGALKNAGGEGVSFRSGPLRVRPRPTRFELKPPVRELDIPKTIEVLRGLRRDSGLFRDFSRDDLEDFAEACSPLSFVCSQVLFSRGELAVWFGVLLSGQAVAYLPEGGAGGDNLILGSHGAGRLVGSTRACLWEKSHVRAYSLKASEAGYMAVITYDQLESWRRTRPSFHLAVMQALLMSLADGAAGFFRGCPLSSGTKWPVKAFSERRILDFLLKFREGGSIFAGVDYRALLALACRLRVAQFEARTSVLTRGCPLSAALIVLDGKLTGFRDPGAAPSAWFGPGDAVCLDAALGGRRPCAIDVFAARPTLVAVLLAEDLADLGREFPAFASQVLQSLYTKLLAELAEPHGRPLLLLADGAAPVEFAPGAAPPLPPGPGRSAGGLEAASLQSALRLAEATAPLPSHRGPGLGSLNGPGGLGPSVASALSANWPRAAAGAMQAGGQSGYDDALLSGLMMAPDMSAAPVSRDASTLRALMLASDPGCRGGAAQKQEDVRHSAWLLGSFFSEKLVANKGLRSQRAKEARHAGPVGGAADAQAETNERSTSAPPAVSRPHLALMASEARRSRIRTPAALCKSMQGLDVSATDFDPSAPVAPHSSGLRRAFATARGAARALELERRLGDAGSSQPPKLPSQPWALRRSRSAPPDRSRLPAGDLERSYTGASGLVRAATGALERGQATCPNCGTGFEMGADSRRRRRASTSSRSPPPGDGWRAPGWEAGLRSSSPSRCEQQRSSHRGYGYAHRPGVGGPAEGLATSMDAVPLARSTLHPSASHMWEDDGYSRDGGLRPTGQELEKDLWWYFEQQRRFLFDLRSAASNPEETVAADQHQAWNVKVISQQTDIERLQAQVRELEADKMKMQEDVTNALRERDEWKASALRMQLNREFKTTVESLSANEKRFLRAGQHTSLPDFEQSLRQQLQLMETPIARMSMDGLMQETDHRPPPALRTFPRMPGRL